MSKKYKIKKKIAVPEASSESKQTKIPGPAKLKTASTLILFDRKTKIFLVILLVAYLLLSSLKIHTSNIANWDLFFGMPKSESVIAGKPRFIRMDEWMITAPGIIGQYNAGMPIKNESFGDLNTPVIFGFPVKEISTILRPNLWPYFIFDVERAFAFAWNFNIFFFLVSTFLLLMLLTRNNFWLSVVGTFFIFLSGGLQWWSYYIGNYMVYLNGMFISFAYILYHKKPLTLITAGLVLIVSVYDFIFGLYPPYQVPLVYLYLFLFIGFLFQQKNFKSIKENWQLKTIVLGASLIILGVFTYHYYYLVKDTYTQMLNTVYPGRRFSTGGNLKNGKLFAEFFGIFMTDTHPTSPGVPAYWQNICEASSFIMFFPIVFYAMGYYYFKTKKTDPLLISISIFLIIGLIYVLLGFPAFLSKVTLFSMSPDYRALPIVGVGNCFLLICYIASSKTEIKKETISWVELGVIAAATFVFMLVISAQINKATDNFFTSTQVSIATALIVISYLLTRYKNFRLAKTALLILLIGMVIPNANVNPLTKGLAPILDNPLVVDSKEIHARDPEARWALFGNTRLTHLLKANGINVFNCVKFVPPLKDMKVLDPTGKYDSTYNRYAWMSMNSKEVSPYFDVNWNDTVIFRQSYEDGYTIYMDPCSPKLKQLGVKYFVFDTVPGPKEVRCMTMLKQNAGLFIYKRNDQ
ncbi:MAG TPA: hypothetical protein VNM35_09240 [Chitinophagaceae bacterium]|nr:hypothetical protein [Chitinophagaceae bacterium]